ncbi:MAG: S8 family serine peptidase [Chloroflexota bacterium]|nr:S8 family serine peptidase [Chloroflexota bacterium]
MRRSAALVVALALVVCFTVFTTPAAAGVGPLHSVIVVLRDDVDSDSVADEHSQRFGALVSHVYGAVLRGYAARVPERLVTMLQRDPRVAFVEEDRLLRATDTIPRTGVDRIDGDQSQVALSGGSVATGVAIIDTGISKHPALNIKGGYNCAGFFFVNRNAWTDGNGHGTHVAGTVAATKMSDIVGVAPGAPLWAVRVLGSDGSGYLSWIICGINWVANNAASKGIKVANMSLGGSGADDGNCGNTNNDSMHKAICSAVSKGVTFVVAAGNDNRDFSTFTPAAYNEVLTVTAMADFDGLPGGGWTTPTCGNVDDTAATFSNFTSTANAADVNHTIAAPGVCITSTYLNNAYATGSGTSFASPHVAGTVALCLADRPGPTPGVLVRGPCFGKSPLEIRAKIRGDAADRSASDPAAESYYGFTNDPNKAPIPGRYYGYLVYAGGY